MKEKLLSVVIPTKNRQKYCVEAVKHMCNFSRDELEIVVYDNSDEPSLKDKLNTLDFKGTLVNYYYDPEELSFSENFNRAASKATGEYICLIGDDDSVLIEIFDIAYFAKNKKIESIISSRPLAFTWPVDDFSKGTLLLTEYDGSIKVLDNQESLLRLMQNSFQDYNRYHIPRIYHGLVRREVLLKIWEKGLEPFGGISPDIYSSILLCFELKKNYMINCPFTIAGASPHSGSALSSRGKHCGELSEAPHFKGLNNYVWPELLPKYYSVETVWAEAAIQAIKDLGQSRLLENFSVENLLAQSYVKNKSIRSLILKAEKKHREGDMKRLFIFWYYTYSYNYTRLKEKAVRFLTRKLFPTKLKNIKGCNNLYDVEKIWNKNMTFEMKNYLIRWKHNA